MTGLVELTVEEKEAFAIGLVDLLHTRRERPCD